MHMPRAHRVDAALVAECVNENHIEMIYTKTMDMVAVIGTKRIMDPHSWLKALYLINIATPKVWDAKSLPAYYNSQADDGLPMKPGGSHGR